MSNVNDMIQTIRNSSINQDIKEEIIAWINNNRINNNLKTNADKFREVFGFEISRGPRDCTGLDCLTSRTTCDSCPNNGFWHRPYEEHR